MFDERGMPESCLVLRGDSTGIIKPEGTNRDLGQQVLVEENSILNYTIHPFGLNVKKHIMFPIRPVTVGTHDCDYSS
jgi:hypothetical protein